METREGDKKVLYIFHFIVPYILILYYNIVWYLCSRWKSGYKEITIYKIHTTFNDSCSSTKGNEYYIKNVCTMWPLQKVNVKQKWV